MYEEKEGKATKEREEHLLSEYMCMRTGGDRTHETAYHRVDLSDNILATNHPSPTSITGTAALPRLSKVR